MILLKDKIILKESFGHFNSQKDKTMANTDHPILLEDSCHFTIAEIGEDLRETGTITATSGAGTLTYAITARDDPRRETICALAS